jgi:hypothetical protein
MLTQPWVTWRMVQLACVSISFYFLIAASATPTSKLAVTIIKPQATMLHNAVARIPGLNATQPASSVLNDVTIRIGVWTFCVLGVQDSDQSTFCSGMSFSPPKP